MYMNTSNNMKLINILFFGAALTLHPHMFSAHGSVSLQLLIVPVWSDREIPNSNCVLTVEVPPPGFAVTLVHSGFKQVSLRRTTLWLQTALKKKSLKNCNTVHVLLKTVSRRYVPKKTRL